jgi:hypothetical protein
MGHTIDRVDIQPNPVCGRAVCPITQSVASIHHIGLIWLKSRHWRYRAPKLVAPNSDFCVEGCERQYCGGALTSP